VRGEEVAGGGVGVGGNGRDARCPSRAVSNGRDARCPSRRQDGGSPCLGDTGKGVIGVEGDFAGGFRGEEDAVERAADDGVRT